MRVPEERRRYRALFFGSNNMAATASKSSKKGYGGNIGLATPAMSASRPAKKGGKATCTSVRVEKAENGFSVTCSYDNSGMESYQPSKQHVFGDAGSMAAFVAKVLGAKGK